MNKRKPNHPEVSESCCGPDRRQVLRSLVGGSLLLPGILAELLASDSEFDQTSLLPKTPHFTPRAKQVIFLYMSGGVSHVDSFDPKPRLLADHGKTIQRKKTEEYLSAPRWEFKPHGASGIEVSELFPHVAECVDDLCIVRSMKNSHNDHFQASLGIHTGSVTFTRPAMGAWLSYGLGTFNQNLPSFVVLAPKLPYAGEQVWSSDFLPAVYQGVRIQPGETPVPNLQRRSPSEGMQELELGLIEFFNRRHLHSRESDSTLAARIKSFESAFGMQREAPELFDLADESDSTLQMYGLERDQKEGFAWQCLMARRLVQRGVRFVELIDTGTSGNWDQHLDIMRHEGLAKNVDQPIAGLIKDLKQRGMLKDTLVVWTTEFGRTPFVNLPTHKGREHHASAYSSWLAGGGVKGGITYGKTDDYGIEIAENEVHVHDFHATILHLLGLDHEKLTFRYSGRDFRLTDVHGRVIHDILA